MHCNVWDLTQVGPGANANASREWVVGLGKYIETGTAGQHQSGGPCCGDYCPLWEVGLGGEEEKGENIDTESCSAPTHITFVCSLLCF